MAVLGLDPRINPAIPIGCLRNGVASFAKWVRVEDGRVKPGHMSPGPSPGHHGDGRRQSYIFFCCVRSQPTTSGFPLVFASSTLYFQLTFAKLSDRLSCGASSEPALTL